MDDLPINRKSREELMEEISRETFKRKTVSFYKYVKITNPQEFRDMLFVKFEELNCRGRIYVASEGINAQMSVPLPNWEVFDSFITSIPELSGVPYKVAVEDASSPRLRSTGKDKPSFIKLIVKVKKKIVADGLDDSTFDPSDTGAYATAEDVNDMIERGATVVDMRNAYEAEVGHFENAKIMNVDTFREQLAKVEEEFEEDKDKEVLLYCTGGIRCEKASAWMKHKGFKNVKHIKGGIIDYAHQVEEKGLPNKFKGKNFVFDGRRGERIGNEIISKCHLCKTSKSDDHHDCINQYCNAMFIGCGDCVTKYKGHCGWFCKTIAKFPKRMQIFYFYKIRKPFRHLKKRFGLRLKKKI